MTVLKAGECIRHSIDYRLKSVLDALCTVKKVSSTIYLVSDTLSRLQKAGYGTRCNGNAQCRALQLDHDAGDIEFFSRCMPFYAEVGAEGFSHNLKS